MTINANKIKLFIATEWLIILSVVIISTVGLFILDKTSKPMFNYYTARDNGYSDLDIQKATGVDIAQIRKDGYGDSDIAKAFEFYIFTIDENKLKVKKPDYGNAIVQDTKGIVWDEPVKSTAVQIADEFGKWRKDQILKDNITYVTILNTDKSELNLKKTIIYFYILILLFRFTFWAIKWVRSTSKDELR